MLTSYVGIATRHGLEVFLPEHEHLLRFLARRSRREGLRRAVCYWAVLPEEAAREIGRLVRLGDPYAALLALDRAAKEFGPILPPPEAEKDTVAQVCLDLTSP